MDNFPNNLVRLKSTMLYALLIVCANGCSSFYAIPKYSGRIPEGKSPLKIAVIGDLQQTSFLETWRERNNRPQIRQIQLLAATNPDLVVTLGDNVFWGSSDDDWAYFDRLLIPLRKRGIPIMPVLGNHEYFGSISDMYNQIQQRFPLYKSLWYYQIVDSIGFVMINTNFSDLGGKVMAEQRGWFVQTMRKLDRNTAVQYIVVCGHHPPFTNSVIVDDDEILQSYFLPIYMQSVKGAIWFSGHCHAYERFSKGGKQFIVSGGGGGPRQNLVTGILEQHKDQYAGSDIRPMHYCTLQRTASALVMEMVPLQYREEYLADTLRIELQVE
ncbi:MAG: metallophosphoesterase [Ignavibacteria bacterium]|nr:metallophosphoesterase [Ignavibacteria bacterium]